MAEHTKGQLRATSRGWLEIGDNKIARAFESNPAMGFPGTISIAAAEANQRRLSAVWNACEGMADPAAEIAALQTIAEAARTYIAAWYGGEGGQLPMSRYRSALFNALEHADIKCK